MMEKFADKCVWYVARELARERRYSESVDWNARARGRMEDAQTTINAMTNLELLKLIEEVHEAL